MRSRGERLFAWLLLLYPRPFRERYRDDLLAFFRQDRQHPRYGSSAVRPIRFWIATVRDLIRTAWSEHRIVRRERAMSAHPRSSWTGRVWRDLHEAWRGLWASPGVTLSALAVLTLGIGAGTSVFSVVDAVVLRGLPFDRDERLVSVAETDLASGRTTVVAPQNFTDWVRRQDAFESMGAISGAGVYTTQDEPVETLRTYRVFGPLFDVLHAKAARGRVFTSDDERPGAAPVAIISDQLWQRRFNADPAIVGRTIVSTRTGEATIVGVMPRGFSYPIASTTAGAVDVWLPFTPTADMLVRGKTRLYTLSVIARLEPNVTVADAGERMGRIRDALAVESPAWFEKSGVSVRTLQDAMVGASVRSWMLLLLAAVMVVVLLGCLNAANLQIARTLVRAPELAVRTALGASRWDLARSLLMESLLLSLLGAAGGILLATGGIEVLRSTLPAGVPRLAAVAPDLRILTVAALAAVVSGVMFGTMPALQASRPDVVSLLGHAGRTHSGGRANRRLRTALVVVEVALAVVLLSGSALFAVSFFRVTSIDLGFDPKQVVIFLGGVMSQNEIQPARTPDGQTKAVAGQAIAATLLEHVRAVPGVVATTLMQGGTPLSGSYVSVPVQRVDGQPGSFTDADELTVRSVGAGYLDAMHIALQRGRWIADTDGLGTTPVVVLNHTAAQRYFGSRDPIGQGLRVDGYERQVIGVTGPMRWRGPESEPVPESFIPYPQTSHSSAQLLVRVDPHASGVIPAIQRAIRGVMPDAGAATPTFLEQNYASLLAQRRFNMIILAIFGIVAVAIAAIGIYGLMAFLVAQRRREIGIRVALGAVPSGILSMMLGRAMRLMVLGLVPGIVAAVLLERTVRGFLFNAQPHDPALYAVVAIVFMAAGVIAAIGPARRATRVDPLVALRQE